MNEDEHIIRRRDRISLGDSVADLDRALRHGDLISLAPGAYIDSETWKHLPPAGRHRLRVLAAVERLKSETIISHFAAAALWGLDIWRRWPATVDLLIPHGRGRSSGSFRRHRSDIARHQVVLLGEFSVTSPAQTAADIATVVPFAEAVVTMDSVLRPRLDGHPLGAFNELRDAALRLRGTAGSRRALSAAEFASGESESALESISRAFIAQAGFPDPVLQHEFRGTDGFRARVDFWWPDAGVIGEADGRSKYGADDDPASTRTAIIAEKNRENRLRTMSAGFARWEYGDITRPGRLTSILQTAGLRSTNPARF